MSKPNNLPTPPLRSDTESVFKASAGTFFPGISNYVADVKAYASAGLLAANPGMVAYSGFSAINYLYQPYNSALDFGVADWHSAIWFKSSAVTVTGYLFERIYYVSGAYSGPGIRLYLSSSGGQLVIAITNNGYTTSDVASTTETYDDGAYHLAWFQRVGSNLLLYVDDALVLTLAITIATGSLSNTSANLAVGLALNGTNPASTCSLDGFRIGTGSFTAAQIKEIYRQEQGIFGLANMHHPSPSFMPSPGCQVMALCDNTGETVTGLELLSNTPPLSTTTDWTVSANCTLSVVSNNLRATSVAAGSFEYYQNTTTVIGSRYKIAATFPNNTTPASAILRAYDGATVIDSASTATTGTVQFDFTATSTTTKILIAASNASAGGQYVDLSMSSARIVDSDISGNRKGLAVYGSITKTAVFPATPGVMPLTDLPILPASSDAATYVASCLTYLSALPAFITQLNTFANQTAVAALPAAPSRTVSDAAYLPVVDAYLAALVTFRTQVNGYAGGPGVWTAGGSISPARHGLAGAGTATTGLVFGGNAGANSAVTEEYDGATWTGSGAMATARYYLAGCGAQTAALGFGGYTGADSAVTEKYNGATWATGASLATARFGVAAAGIQNAALCFGVTSGTEEYDGAAWAAGGNMIAVRTYPGGAGTQTAALCFGGDLGGTEEYNGTTWSAGGALLLSRQQVAGCGGQTAALCFGGFGVAAAKNTERYDGTTWSADADLLVAKYLLAGAGAQTSAISMGGHDGSYYATTEEYLAGI